MPEYSDTILYVDAIETRIMGQSLIQTRLQNPFLLRIADPSPESFDDAQLCKQQRIRYATNETNYCPACQTNGKILLDRSLSRLLKKRLNP